MRTDYNTAAAQGGRVHNCGLCGKQWYESMLRACPCQGGRLMCAYCCRSCGESYRDGAMDGCRAADRARQARKAKEETIGAA